MRSAFDLMSDTSPADSVRQINAAETIDIRWPVLRAGLPRASAIFPGDDHPATRHFGAFASAEGLVAVASVYIAPLPEYPQTGNVWQLRGMATLPAAQRQGFGSALVRACLAAVIDAGGEILWCNARTPARSFYAMHGFTEISAEFDIPTAGPHVRMWRNLRL